MSSPAGRLTALARPVDPTVGSNRLVLLASVLVTGVATVATLATAADPAVPSAVGRGIGYGLGTFLAWAIARELHPDEPRAAALAMAAYAPAMLLGPPRPAALLALLLAVRVTVRSTGRAPTLVDLVALVAVAGVAATSASGLVVALALAFAIHDDRRLPAPASDREHEVAAVATAAVAVVVTVLTGSSMTAWRGPTLAELGLLAVAVAAVSRLRRPAVLEARGDRTGAPLHLDRLVRARRLAVVALAGAVVWAGGDALPALAPAAAAVVGTALAAPRLLRARDLGTPVEPPTGPA